MRTSYVKLLLGSLLLGTTLIGCERFQEQQAPIEAQTPTCSLAEYRTAGATNEPFTLSFTPGVEGSDYVAVKATGRDSQWQGYFTYKDQKPVTFDFTDEKGVVNQQGHISLEYDARGNLKAMKSIVLLHKKAPMVHDYQLEYTEQGRVKFIRELNSNLGLRLDYDDRGNVKATYLGSLKEGQLPSEYEKPLYTATYDTRKKSQFAGVPMGIRLFVHDMGQPGYYSQGFDYERFLSQNQIVIRKNQLDKEQETFAYPSGEETISLLENQHSGRRIESRFLTRLKCN